MTRSIHDLKRDEGGVDVALEREIDFIVNDVGLPREDAREIAERHLGRPTAAQRAKAAMERTNRAVADAKQSMRPRQSLTPIARPMTINLGGAKAAVTVKQRVKDDRL